jgi:hypothetical protein
MEITRSFKKAPRWLAAAAVMSTLMVGAVALSSSPASATPTATLSVSNNAASLGGVTNGGTDNTYSWGFTTAGGALTQLTLEVPTGTGGTLSAATIYGLGSCVPVAPSLTAGLITIDLNSCGTVSAGPVEVQISGFTNSTFTGSFSSGITTYASATPVDTLTAAAITFENNTTAVHVIVPESLTFTNSATDITLLPAPLITATADVTLGVTTNATNGYSVAGCVLASSPDNRITDADSTIIPQMTTAASDVTTGQFGAEATSVSGSPTINTTQFPASNFNGYSPLCDASGLIFSSLVPTTGTTPDQVTMTNGVKIAADQQAGNYNGLITYLVTPSY